MALYQYLKESSWDRKEKYFKNNFSPCRLCPRECSAKREINRKGICLAGKELRIASFNLHFGEEPPISGKRGSGTIFFSGCTLKCIFCQNFPISQLNNGKHYSIDKLAEILLGLQERGAHNINLVSPTPYLNHFVSALRIAAGKGLNIPIVLNSGGYERVDIIKELEGIIDVYMPDFKYSGPEISEKYSGVRDYHEIVLPAISEMYRQVGSLITDDDDVAVKGLIIRHLILPGHTENSISVLKKIGKSSFRNAYQSLMSQFFPAYRSSDDIDLKRRLTSEEYEEVKSVAIEEGLVKGWFQDI
ncbi:MAG: radical SAM protein [Acidobacteriota bacterium]